MFTGPGRADRFAPLLDDPRDAPSLDKSVGDSGVAGAASSGRAVARLRVTKDTPFLLRWRWTVPGLPRVWASLSF